MALTRKFLKALSIEDEKIDQIIEEHTAVTDRMKTEIDQYKAGAERLPGVQKQLEQAQADLAAARQDGWKDRYDKLKTDFDGYKKDVEAKASRAAKQAAVRAYLESKHITGGNLAIAMRGLGAEIDAAELEDGKLKDTKALDDLISGELKGLVTVTREQGAPPPATPPQNTGGRMTRDEIFKITDRTARRAAIAANMDLFDKGD